MSRPTVACLATQGTGSNDEARVISLVEELAPAPLPFDRAHKLRSALGVLRRLARTRPDVVVLEGTGIAGGVALIAARRLLGVRYVVSSGDAVAPFVGSVTPWLRPLAGLYERLLYRGSSGFIGWSPYLVGRALTLGAPAGMTAAGWPPASARGIDDRERVRGDLGIEPRTLVFGIVGSLAWNERAGYCYGLELVRAVRRVSRRDVHVLVVGDGSGRKRLEQEAGDDLGSRVTLTGAVDRDSVPAMLAAMDVVSLPQTVDGVGSFRYTTKLSEYLEARRPVVTSQIPLAYDLDGGWLWRLPGSQPWRDPFVQALAELMERVTAEEVALHAERVPADLDVFDGASQRRRAAQFIRDVACPERPGRAGEARR